MAYPDALSNVSAAPAGSETLGGSTPTHTEHHGELAAAVNETQSALGLNPEGDYATVAARLDALDLPVFDPVSYGAAVDGSTDDTTAWQDAIDAAGAAGGGVVRCSKPGVSVIGGALQDTSGANAQLTLPAVDYADGEAVPIVICGGVTPAVVPSVIGSTPVPDRHVVLKSTLASGTGALLGAYGPAGTFANFTNVHLVLHDVGFRTATNPTNSAVDLRRVATATVERVIVDTGSYDVDGLAQPSTATSYGLRLPANNNGAHVVVRDVDVVGFYTGVEFSEHTILDDVNVWGCRVGFNPVAANHSSVALRAMSVHCTTPVKFTGGVHAVDFWQLDVEHASSSHGWRQTTYDVDDASNYGRGFVRWWAVLAGSGAHDSFVKNGGSSVTTSRVGDALGSGGGGSTIYSHRDRLLAAAGDNTLTLGATPVAGSPLVWVNGAIKWPVTDYAISGSVITFGSALSASDVVLCKYESTTSAYTAATISGGSITISDDFNRANSTSTLGSTSVGSNAWTAHSGTWGINSSRAYLASNTVAVCPATIEAGGANVTVSAKMYAANDASARYAGLVGRADATAANCWLVEYNAPSGYIRLMKRTAGTTAQVGSTYTYTLVDGDVIALVMSGSNLDVKINGTTRISVTDSAYSANTRHGIWTYSDRARFDDFSVTS